MKHRTALASVLAAATLLGTAGMAQANHLPEGDYSPCREGEDTLNAGYAHEAPFNDLPTIYANGDESPSGNIGICSGNRHGHEGQDPVSYLEVGGDGGDGIYVAGNDGSGGEDTNVTVPG